MTPRRHSASLRAAARRSAALLYAARLFSTRSSPPQRNATLRLFGHLPPHRPSPPLTTSQLNSPPLPSRLRHSSQRNAPLLATPHRNASPFKKDQTNAEAI
jgi:hypothetical protein